MRSVPVPPDCAPLRELPAPANTPAGTVPPAFPAAARQRSAALRLPQWQPPRKPDMHQRENPSAGPAEKPPAGSPSDMRTSLESNAPPSGRKWHSLRRLHTPLQFPPAENLPESVPWTGTLFSLHKCRTAYPAAVPLSGKPAFAPPVPFPHASAFLPVRRQPFPVPAAGHDTS